VPIVEKARLGREISGLLFAAEATAMNMTNYARIVCLKIKNHAHVCSGARPPDSPADAWENYDELEALLGQGH
jgi:hypothetical protein